MMWLGFWIVWGALNAFTFILFGYDKWISGSGTRRVPEKILWLFSLLGGSVGGVIGMSVFRHKTRKLSFQLVMGIIFLMQIGILFSLYFFAQQNLV